MSLTNPTYNQLAQVAHFFGAEAIVLAAGRFHHPLAVAGLVIVYGLVKEFWFDLRYETAEVSGGVKGGAIDFAFYVLGAAAALMVMGIGK